MIRAMERNKAGKGVAGKEAAGKGVGYTWR